MTPVRTESPSMTLSWPTRTPSTSVMAFFGPGARTPISIPRSRARLRSSPVDAAAKQQSTSRAPPERAPSQNVFSRATNSPLPRSTFSSPFSTTTRPRLSTVDRPSFHLPPLVRRVADVVVELRALDRHFPIRVPNREVGVGPDRDAPLLREHSVDLRRPGRRELDEPVDVDATLKDTFGEEKRHPHLETGNTVRESG